MTKKAIALSALAMTCVAWGQRTILHSAPPSQARSTLGNTTWYTPYFNTADGATISFIGKGADLWLRDQSQITNKFVGSGDSAFMRGGWEPNIVIFVEGNMKGRIFSVGNGGDYWYDDGIVFANNQTRIVGLDDPNESSVTGNSVDRANARQRVPDNAISVFVRNNQDDQAPEKNMGSYTLVEGNYFGGTGRMGGMFDYANIITIEGASFVAGNFDSNALDDGDIVSGRAPAGLWVGHSKGKLTINNKTDYENDRMQAGNFNANTEAGGGGTYEIGRSLNGGSGLYAENIAGGVEISGGTFIATKEVGSQLRTLSYADFDTIGGYLTSFGGAGAHLQSPGVVTITGGHYIGGDGGNVTVGGPDAYASSIAGAGLYVNAAGTTKILGGTYEAGISGNAAVIPGGYYIIDPDGNVSIAPPTDENGQALAYGASGIFLNSSGATTVSNITAIGSRGGSASATSADSQAYGGSGITANLTELTIEGGTFIGADGGVARGTSDGAAFGGAGVFSAGKNLTIKGGTFSGGKAGTVNGQADFGNAGVIAFNVPTLSISEASSETMINGDIYTINTAESALNITGGTIDGDIYKDGAGTTTMKISTNAIYSGSFVQKTGTVAVALSNSSESKFFSDVTIESGNFTFTGTNKVITAENSVFTLGGTSTNNYLDFGTAGAYLSDGTAIVAAKTQVKAGPAGSGIIALGNNSSITIDYETVITTDTNGATSSKLVAGGIVAGLALTNDSARIHASGIAANPTNKARISTGAITASTNLDHYVDADFGWLTTATITNSGGLVAQLGYRSLTNELTDLGPIVLVIDNAVANLTNEVFYSINAMGADAGSKAIRYSATQLPDTTEVAFQVSQQVSKQIAARGTEFRSMNGYASNQPRLASPTGVAGPQTDGPRTMQGWFRGYASKGDRDASGNYAAYEAGTYGGVIGVDKSFGNLLVGLAGGFSRSDVDSNAYQANVKTYHGSVYSTIGGESVFIDLAATYAMMETTETSVLSDGEFDSDVFSAYIGIGKRFDIKQKLSLTPEASLLATYYKQDAFNRTGPIFTTPVLFKEYDTFSPVSSLGLSVSSMHQIDWLNMGIALIPEVRAHWLHDFNADPDSFTAILYGQEATFGVRPREEDMLRFGAGFDVWSWRHQNSKFELDYDGLFSSDYSEHIFSGKITYRF